MYFWNSAKLASEIKLGQLTGKQKKTYYLASSLLALFSSFLAGSSITTGATEIVELFLLVIITIIGINLTYTANGGENGHDYIERITILSFPIILKVLAIYIAIAVIIGISDGRISQEMFVLIVSSAEMVYFWLLFNHFKEINA